jgi:hypothetical protein
MVLILYVTPSIFFLSNNTNVNTVGTLSLPRKGVLWIWILKVGFELMTDPDPDPGEIYKYTAVLYGQYGTVSPIYHFNSCDSVPLNLLSDTIYNIQRRRNTCMNC